MSRKKSKKKKHKDFPNNWAFYKKLKPKQFNACSFKDFWEGRVHYWELVPGITLVARLEHLTSGHVEEYYFHSTSEVNNFFKKVLKSGEPFHAHCFDSVHCFTAAFNTDDDD